MTPPKVFVWRYPIPPAIRDDAPALAAFRARMAEPDLIGSALLFEADLDPLLVEVDGVQFDFDIVWPAFVATGTAATGTAR